MKNGAFAVLRIALGLIFILSGILKLREPVAFADAIYGFQMLPIWAVTPLAATLPFLELLLGGMLVVKFHPRVAAFGVGALLLAFTAVLISAKVRGINVDCSCFGRSGFFNMDAGAGIVRNVLLLSVTGVLYGRELWRDSLERK